MSDWSSDGPDEDGKRAYKIGWIRMGPRYSTRKTVRHPSWGPVPDGGQWSGKSGPARWTAHRDL